MNISERLKSVVGLLSQKNLKYSLAGGLVASLYREEERLTKDLDILILAESNHEIAASDILKSLNLTPVNITKAELEGGPLHSIKSKNTPVWMICGTSKDKDSVRVDFLLPTIPWFHKALERSQKNTFDFGFEKIPCLTKEDLIISKLFALTNRSDRFKDLDDLQSIFRSKCDLDLIYLTDRMMEMKIKIPDSIRKEVPKVLLKVKRY